jgi:hypothetical protein
MSLNPASFGVKNLAQAMLKGTAGTPNVCQGVSLDRLRQQKIWALLKHRFTTL